MWTDLLLPALAIVALALVAYGCGWEGCRRYWTRKNTEAMRRSGLITPEYMKQIKRLARQFRRESRKRWGGRRRKELDLTYDEQVMLELNQMEHDPEPEDALFTPEVCAALLAECEEHGTPFDWGDDSGTAVDND